ncbi:Zinc finger protein [Fusarium oxysporum f. sp. albedinis]|nr:Zinc finger protein [Fusarium oxysporum f. sp. albedinis]
MITALTYLLSVLPGTITRATNMKCKGFVLNHVAPCKRDAYPGSREHVKKGTPHASILGWTSPCSAMSFALNMEALPLCSDRNGLVKNFLGLKLQSYNT